MDIKRVEAIADYFAGLAEEAERLAVEFPSTMYVGEIRSQAYRHAAKYVRVFVDIHIRDENDDN